MAKRFTILVLATLLMAACDLISTDRAGSEVRTSLSFEDVSLEAGGDTAHVALRYHFAATDRAGFVSFEAASDQSFVQAVVVEDSLWLAASDVGSATVSVTALGENGDAATLDILVLVSGFACPPGPSAGMVDFIPIESNEVWEFDYETRQYRVSEYPHTRSEGVLTLTLGASSCRGGVRTVKAVETASGNNYVLEEGEWVLRSQTDTLHDVVLEESVDGVRFPWWDVIAAPRYYDAGLDSIVVVQPIDCYGDSNVTTKMERGGLLYYSYDCLLSHYSRHFVLRRR
jgi:hypothetical protein